MASSQAVATTLLHVTEIKLAKLSVQQKQFQDWKDNVNANLQKETEPIKQIQVLLEAMKEQPKLSHDDKISHDDKCLNTAIEKFTEQALYDHSVGPELVEQWKALLWRQLDHQTSRYQFTNLFSRLVMEWIQKSSAVVMEPRIPSDRRDSKDSEDSEGSFEQVGREEMHAQRKVFESYAFTEKVTDTDRIKRYLDSLFVETDKSKSTKFTPLKTLRESIADFGEAPPLRFTADGIENAINGLVKADLFDGEKRKALTALKGEKTVLKEIADVLNTDLESLHQWDWQGPVPVNMRKQINGKYRFYMNEELYQAIFIQFIGTTLAVHLKDVLRKFFNSGAWLQSSPASLTKKDIRRREYFLGDLETKQKTTSIRNRRRKIYQDNYFMTQLPSTIEESSREYADEESGEDMEFQGTAIKLAGMSVESRRSQHSRDAYAPINFDGGDDGDVKSPLKIKQSILHLITTELLIQRHIYGKFAVVQTDFRWFGPSIPHSSLFTVLEYFGFTEKWMSFFRRFLQAPLYFTHDGANAEIRNRARGIPIGHVLSDALGEVMLFALDFAVNQNTDGVNLFRFHDDLDFFADPDTCVTAWKTIRDFADVMGLELAEEKTGSVVIAKDPQDAAKTQTYLPKGEVRWGFLKLESSGRWQVDEDMIDVHIKEMKRQLSTCRSVFDYVQSYNTYMAHFFINNLGEAANCMGQDHIDRSIATITRIQKALFSDELEMNHGVRNVMEYLRHRIETNEDLMVKDLKIPDGFFYFPIALGGLYVQNPLISLLLRRQETTRSPEELIQRDFEHMEEVWEDAKQKFEQGKVRQPSHIMVNMDNDEAFMSFSEYMKAPEERSIALAQTFDLLMRKAEESVVAPSYDVRWAYSGNISPHQKWMNQVGQSYGQWMLQLYGKGVIESVGGLMLGERELLPLGLVDAMKRMKVRWQG